MEVNMNETTTDTPKEDGFTIYRVSRRNTRNTGRERYTNKNRRNERMRLLHQVANGTLEPEVAARHLSRTYAQPTPRFHHSVTKDGRININGVVPGQSITLMVDEWNRLSSYLSGKNFKRFVDRNSDRLRTRRGPYTRSDEGTEEVESETHNETPNEDETVDASLSSPIDSAIDVHSSGITG